MSANRWVPLESNPEVNNTVHLFIHENMLIVYSLISFIGYEQGIQE